MNKIQKKRLYESIMRSVSKTVKKKLNAHEYSESDYGDVVMLFSHDEYDDDNWEPYCIVHFNNGNARYVKDALYDYFKNNDEACGYLRYDGLYEIDDKKIEKFLGTMYDLEYSDSTDTITRY